MNRRQALPIPLLILLLFCSCGDDDGPDSLCSPPVAGGRIEGEVRVGGDASAITITATRVTEKPGEVFALNRSTYDDGHFAFDVPAGRYVVSCLGFRYAKDGPAYGTMPGDTLTVDPLTSPVRFDFDLASLQFTLTAPEFFEGKQAQIRLYREGEDENGPLSRAIKGGTILAGRREFRMRGVLPGRYRLRVGIGWEDCSCIDERHEGEFFWYPDARSPEQAEWLEFLPDRMTEVAMNATGSVSRITGAVGGAWKEMRLGPPDVSLFGPDGSLLLGPRTLSTDGSIAIDMLYSGPAKVRLEHDGIPCWVGGRTFEEAAVFTLDPSTPAHFDHQESGILLESDQPGELGAPQPIVIFRSDGTLVGRYDPRRGPVRFPVGIPNLAAGSYLLRIEGGYHGFDPWLRQWFDAVEEPSEATPIPVTAAGEVVRRTVHLLRGATISGTIRTAGVVDQRRYRVLLTPADRDTLWASSESNEARYAIQGVPDGSWKVGLRLDFGGAEDEATFWLPGVGEWDAAEPIVIVDHVDVTLDFERSDW